MTRPSGGWHMRPLDTERHNRSGFSCGVPELDIYLKQRASQDIRRHLARVFVAVAADTRTIAGYYAISAASIRHQDLPAEAAKKLPRYPIPAALIGRLAVDQRYQGTGLGEHLLIDALVRIHSAGETVAIQTIIVDAKSQHAETFYAKYGFRYLTARKERMFLPIEVVKKLYG